MLSVAAEALIIPFLHLFLTHSLIRDSMNNLVKRRTKERFRKIFRVTLKVKGDKNKIIIRFFNLSTLLSMPKISTMNLVADLPQFHSD